MTNTGHLPIASLTILPIQPIDMGDLGDIVRMLQMHEMSSKLERPILRPRDAYDAKRHHHFCRPNEILVIGCPTNQRHAKSII